MRRVKEMLDAENVPTFMVDAGGAGGTFGDIATLGLHRAKALLAFCTEGYGAKTGGQYETHRELECAHQKHLRIIPIKLSEIYPPQPEDELGRAQNEFVFRADLVREPWRVAQEVYRAFRS
eukprot:s5616_g6.t1